MMPRRAIHRLRDRRQIYRTCVNRTEEEEKRLLPLSTNDPSWRYISTVKTVDTSMNDSDDDDDDDNKNDKVDNAELTNINQSYCKKDILSEIACLCDDNNITKSIEEILALYHGREELLLKQLKTMKIKMQLQKAVDKEKTKPVLTTIVTEITSLVEDLCLPYNLSADDLLERYFGREALLLTNLKKFQVKQQQQQQQQRQQQENNEVSTHRSIALAKHEDSASMTNLNNIWLTSPLPRRWSSVVEADIEDEVDL